MTMQASRITIRSLDILHLDFVRVFVTLNLLVDYIKLLSHYLRANNLTFGSRDSHKGAFE
jgi:hypothetical protein